VYDPTPSGVRAWIHDIATVNGRPVIVYATLPSAGDHRYRYASWTGRAWEDRQIVAAGGSFEGSGSQPGYSGGIVLDHEDPATVYLSRKVLGRFEIERWRTRDGGKSWSSAPITSGSAKDNVRPFTPRDSTSDDLEVFWMHGDYPDFTHFQTSLLARTSRRELALGRGRLRLGRRDTVEVRLRCLARTEGCEGAVVMTSARKVRLTRRPNLRPRVVRFGSTGFRVHAGRRGEAHLRLSMRAAALVRRRGQVRVRLSATGRTSTGTEYSRSTTTLLTARRQPSRP
jgi:hypothetical protein